MEEEKREQGELFVSTRGAFIKRMVAAGFAVPMIGSFGFTELASASTKSKQCFPNQTKHDNPYPVDTSHQLDNRHPPTDTSHQLNNQHPPVDNSHPNANNGGYWFQ